MISSGNEQLEILEVIDRGIPNRERIAIFAKKHCDLRSYVLMIGHRNIDGTGTPIKDNMIWLGGAQLNPGDWLFVYTAAGQTTPQLIEGTTSMLYSIYWGKDHTIFQNNGLVPMLCQIGMIAMPQIPLPQAQNNRLGVY